MAETKRDDNQVEVMMGVLNTDGSTPTRMQANPDKNSLMVADNTSGSDFGADNAARDNSGNPVLLAVSNADGESLVPLYVNSSGQLLIKTT